MNPLKNILNSVLRTPGQKLNLLVAPFNGFTELMLEKTGHKIFYLPNAKYKFNPKTSVIVVNDIVSMPGDIVIDAVICNDRVVQYDVCLNIARALHVPLVVVEHYHPDNMLHRDDLKYLRLNQVRSEYIPTQISINKAWDEVGDVIPYGIEARDINRGDGVLSVGNFSPMDTINITQTFAPHRTLVYNLEQQTIPINDEVYTCCDIYANLCQHNMIPIPMLEAMSYGIPAVSIKNTVLASLFEHEKNIFFCEDIGQIANTIKLLKSQGGRSALERVGNNGRELVRTQFNLETYINLCNIQLNKVTQKGYLL